MKKNIVFIILLGLLPMVGSYGQKVLGYQIFDGNGKKVSFEKMIKSLEKSDIVLFGEIHNDPIVHWLQYETALALSKTRRMVFGAEMFESDNQSGLDKYLDGQIESEEFKKEVRLWNNYKTDYAKIVELAKEKNIPFIATNVPRKYASMVFRGGFESLDTITQEEKAWIAPLPVDYDANLPGYRNMLDMDMGEHKPTENFPKAQAIKDATMAYFILKHYQPGAIFLHLNGTYHSDNYEGILWYLQKQSPGLRCKTIAATLQKDVSKLEKENKGRADFIICVNENMTTTY